MKYIIKDWAGNTCFNSKTFETFEDAWGFIYEKFPDGDETRDFDDYFVEEIEPKNKLKKHLKKLTKETF